jgi:hypothetical protein
LELDLYCLTDKDIFASIIYKGDNKSQLQINKSLHRNQ